MKRMVWVSTLPNGGRRKKNIGDRNFSPKSQTKEETLTKAREICKRHTEELSKLNFIPDWRKWCSRDPFPPKY